jgi:hypothetical protein
MCSAQPNGHWVLGTPVRKDFYRAMAMRLTYKTLMVRLHPEVKSILQGTVIIK